MMPKKMKLTTVQKISYGIGHVLNDLTAAMWFTYLLVYLHYVLEVKEDTAGMLLLLGQVGDALCTPLVGFLSDNACGGMRCCNFYGKRKSWHALGSICILISFPFIFIKCPDCNFSSEFQWIALSIMICIFQFGWASSQVSHLALIPDISSDIEESDELNIIRYFFDVLSDVFLYTVAWFVFRSSESTPAKLYKAVNPQDGHSFMIITLTVMAVGFITSLIFHIVSKEPGSTSQKTNTKDIDKAPIASGSKTGEGSHKSNIMKHKKKISLTQQVDAGSNNRRITNQKRKFNVSDDSDSSSDSSSSHVSELSYKNKRKGCGRSAESLTNNSFLANDRVYMYWQDWLCEPQFYQITLLHTFGRMVFILSLIYMPIYLQESNKRTDSIALIPLVMSLAGVAATVFVKSTRRLLKKKGSIILACFIGLLACVAMIFGTERNTTPPESSDPTDLLNLQTDLQMWTMYSASICLGVSASMLIILSLALTAEMIGDCNESSAFVYGAMSLVDKLANGVMVASLQQIARISCASGKSCSWFFYRVLVGGNGMPLILSAVIATTLCYTKLGYTRKMRKEEDAIFLNLSATSSSDSSELLLPTNHGPHLEYGSV